MSLEGKTDPSTQNLETAWRAVAVLLETWGWLALPRSRKSSLGPKQRIPVQPRGASHEIPPPTHPCRASRRVLQGRGDGTPGRIWAPGEVKAGREGPEQPWDKAQDGASFAWRAEQK